MKQNLLLIFLIPLFSISQTQTGSNIDIEGVFVASGHNISLSSDGSIFAIGAPNNNSNGNDSGLVEVYKNTSTGWVKTFDTKGENTKDELGYSVSLSSDGSTLAIGAPNYNGVNGDNSGYVQVYRYNESSTVWEKLGDNIEGNNQGDKLGWSVSLSSDGSKIAIGSPDNSSDEYKKGRVQVYEYKSANWTQLGNDIYGETSSDQSGYSVSLSNDGSVLAIGAINNRGDITNPNLSMGHVRVYKYDIPSMDWSQVGSDIDGLASYNHAGTSVSLSSNGSVVAIGAAFLFQKGYVRVFENISGTWTQIGDVIEGDTAQDESGTSVSLSADGSIVAIGAPYNDNAGDDTGHVKIYKNISGNWQKIGNEISGENLSDYSGLCVSLSKDGRNIAIGSFRTVKVYSLSDVLSSNTFVLSQFGMAPNPASSQTTIALNKGLTLKKVSIYNNLGQFIKTTQKEIIDTSDLSTGLYYVQIVTDKGKAAKKLVIE
ncbi:T9SS type A sorting domain-containing protein [Flavivirga algicola]|uniref:T9SS type A sorting domain-containing protein n=1 Tax=Flavivirga algicola TaxID=2729136 RepID=A0ABX1S0G7_9FLAO|nr:T9SS type A sorting domain-containing protein [Flavivirga algicola]NMH89352.1 T9SS type A sorting domain-containing protein [Flavivirga algicola]